MNDFNDFINLSILHAESFGDKPWQYTDVDQETVINVMKGYIDYLQRQ